MNDVQKSQGVEAREQLVPLVTDFGQAANDLCQQAVNDAKAELHPLLRSIDIARLDQRSEFVKAFKLALERRIAQRLAAWYPGIQAVFKFDESWIQSRNSWDGSIHLLVKVPHLSNTIKMLGRKLDESLTNYLQQLGWFRFCGHQSILEVQQVTPTELRHGLSYGAMFYAVYSVPVKVWSSKK